MPSYYRRKRKNARAFKKRRVALIAALAVLLVVLVVILCRCSSGKDATTENAPVQTPEPSAFAAMSAVTQEPMPEATPETTPEPTPQPVSAEKTAAERAGNRPTAEQGWLPIFREAATEEKIVAITVDD